MRAEGVRLRRSSGEVVVVVVVRPPFEALAESCRRRRPSSAWALYLAGLGMLVWADVAHDGEQDVPSDIDLEFLDLSM